MPFARGDTFHYGDSNGTRHLHIVLFDSTAPQEPVIVVSVNTVRDYTDRTLILIVGDHPYIKHDSTVSYNRVTAYPLIVLETVEAASLSTPVGFRNFERDAPVSAALLQKIIEGALVSPRTPKGMKRAVRIRLGLTSAE